jgi:hypothetical protein
MARHWVKLGDNHWAWMSDEEYNKHNSLGCFGWFFVIVMVLSAITTTCDDEKGKDKKEPNVEQSNRKTKKISHKTETKKEENDSFETEASSTLQLQLDPIDIEEEEPEEIIPIGKPENNAADEIIDKLLNTDQSI